MKNRCKDTLHLPRLSSREYRNPTDICVVRSSPRILYCQDTAVSNESNEDDALHVCFLFFACHRLTILNKDDYFVQAIFKCDAGVLVSLFFSV